MDQLTFTHPVVCWILHYTASIKSKQAAGHHLGKFKFFLCFPSSEYGQTSSWRFQIMAIFPQHGNFMFGSRYGFRGRQSKWRYYLSCENWHTAKFSTSRNYRDTVGQIQWWKDSWISQNYWLTNTKANLTLSVWLLTAPDCIGPHQATPDHTGPHRACIGPDMTDYYASTMS